MSYYIVKFQLICIICACFSHNSKVTNGPSIRNAILRKLITVKTCFPQIHVLCTILRVMAILKFVETKKKFVIKKCLKIVLLH